MGDDEEGGGQPKDGLGVAARTGPRTIEVRGTGRLGLTVDKEKPQAETSRRARDEDRLEGRESGQIADPCAADTEHKQGKGNAAARGGAEGGEDAACREKLQCPDGAGRLRAAGDRVV